MKSNILLTMFLAIALSLSVLAKDVNRAQAEKVAVNFFYERSNVFDNTFDYNDLSIKEVRKVDNAYYVVNFENGWVLVAADDAMVPVLGYNFEGQFMKKEFQSYNVKSYLQHFVELMNFIRENDIQANEEVTTQWDRYMNSDPESLLAYRGSRNDVGPLLTVKWDQSSPYNLYCPPRTSGPNSSGRALVGCVATAMSQIMYYWRYPLQGSGSHSYYCPPYGTISVNFGEATYDWNAMMDRIDNDNPWEIAEISFHAGVSVDMDYYDDGGSGAYSYNVPHALETYFVYDNASLYIIKDNYPLATWKNMIQGDLDDLHPVYYSGFSTDGGHAFICDGYQGDDYFHFNFGWGGNSNGFYTLYDVGGFHYDQSMVYKIYPEDPNYPYIPDEQVLLTSSSGSFTDGSGPVYDYPSNWSGSWLIDPQTETDSILNITLSFVEFNTASSDYVRVYDGETTDAPMIGEYSGSEVPGSITSSGNKMLITFNTSGSGAGFKAEYTSRRPIYCQAQEFFTDPFGTISDGSGSFNYNNLTSCIYIIQVPEAVNYNIDFTSFSTEADKDKLTIYNGDEELIVELSGSEVPDHLEISTDMLILIWSTNATVTDDGWSFDYTVDGVGVGESFSYDNLTIYPNPADNELHVAFDIERSQNLEVKLINMNGQVVREDALNAFSGHYTRSFDLNNLAKGVYILSIVSDKGKADKKVVLK